MIVAGGVRPAASSDERGHQMTGPGYGYSEGAHEAASKHVREVNAQLQQQLTQLAGRLDSLQGAWSGTAAASFQGLHQRWNADTVKLNNTLESIAGLLDKSGSTYASTEEEGQAGFSKILGALGS
jgi:early secretory antigenic target protein ESAT-6